MADVDFYRTCPACGKTTGHHPKEWDAGRDRLVLTCSDCGREWEQWGKFRWGYKPDPLVCSLTYAAQYIEVKRATVVRWLRLGKIRRAWNVVTGEKEPQVWWADVKRVDGERRGLS